MKSIYRYLKLLAAMLLLPALMMLYSCGEDPPPLYTLTVTSGSGSGQYEEGETVSIAADAAASGEQFVAWTGDVSTVADATAASTTLTMPASDISITATYEVITYALTVNNGSGTGSYEEGAEVEVIANEAPEGEYFDQWTGDVSSLSDASNDTATVTMPASAVTITASYLAKPTVSVLEGTWQIDKFYEKFDTDEFVEVVSSANDNFRLTFNFTDDYQTDTYSMILGAVLAVPNFNSESNSGMWEVDDVDAPTTLTFDPGGMSSTITVESASADRVVISWTVPSTIAGKPDQSFKIELVPAA